GHLVVLGDVGAAICIVLAGRLQLAAFVSSRDDVSVPLTPLFRGRAGRGRCADEQRRNDGASAPMAARAECSACDASHDLSLLLRCRDARGVIAPTTFPERR